MGFCKARHELKADSVRELVQSSSLVRLVCESNSINRMNQQGEQRSDCGKLFPNWATDPKTVKVLSLREACNKIIHATDIRFDVVVPDAAMNPDEEGAYYQARLYLYGSKGTQRLARRAVVDRLCTMGRGCIQVVRLTSSDTRECSDGRAHPPRPSPLVSVTSALPAGLCHIFFGFFRPSLPLVSRTSFSD